MAEVKYYFRKLLVVFFANFVQFSRTRNALHFYETDIAAGRRKMTEKGEKKKKRWTIAISLRKNVILNIHIICMEQENLMS